VDKSNVFETFFGTLKSAPLVKNCPLAMECRLIDTYNLPANDIFIGEIVASYADPEVMTAGKVDLAKVKPLLFDMTSVQYWSIGSPVAKCWHEGKKLKSSEVF
jgi:flavin reductase (DIM6/NTAB) family NADH-FMN oxidoreductase RutF